MGHGPSRQAKIRAPISVGQEVRSSGVIEFCPGPKSVGQDFWSSGVFPKDPGQARRTRI